MIKIHLLGGFETCGADGLPIKIESRKGRALLAYLASPAGRPRTREQVCDLLWRDRGQDQARSSLRQLLAVLRSYFQDQDLPLKSNRESLELDATVVVTDTAIFDRYLKDRSTDSLKAALQLYRGTFLENLELGEAGYEDWAHGERRRMHEDARSVCRILLDNAQSTGDRDLIRQTASRMIELEPGDEEGHRALMRLYAIEGDVPAALRQYQTCRDYLERDFGILPSAESDRLADELRRGKALSDGSYPLASSSSITMTGGVALGPTIAILPFETPSELLVETHFTEGLTQDIATELSRFRGLVVRIGDRSATDFAVSGRVRRFNDRVRIDTKLIDCSSGAHLWAEHYDRPLDEVFGVLDDLVATVASTLVGRVEAACALAARRKPPSSLEAYECVLRGDALPVGDSASEAEARSLYAKAVELDPECGRARAMLAYQLSLE